VNSSDAFPSRPPSHCRRRFLHPLSLRESPDLKLEVPAPLAEACARSHARTFWLERLPARVAQLAARWSLRLGRPFTDGSAAWVAPAIRSDGTPAILKIGLPHMEAEHEIAALRLLDGNPTVQVLEADEAMDAMLLERCDPGTPLDQVFQPEQDVIIAGLLKRFWRIPEEPHPFRDLSVMIHHWIAETRDMESHWHDVPLVAKGIETFEHLSETSISSTLLATDLHAGNVLRASREPWLVIDPKPFVGDRAYDATQHLMNCRERMRADPFGTMRRVADLLEVDYHRVRLWMFARYAAEPRTDWDDDLSAMARSIGR
jgi:streptomycin 6-kinase